MLGAGYIKLWRSLLKWEWYSDVNVSRLFIHLLLTANYEDTTWRGETIHRGQRLTSVAKLAEETGLTTKEVRTALGKLTRTNELTIRTTNKYSVITVEKYDFFQSPTNTTGKQEGEQSGTQGASKGQTKGEQPGNKGRINKAIIQESQEENISSSGGDAHAREAAESAVTEYLGYRCLDASTYFGVSEQELATVAAYTDAIFARFARRPPTDADRASVFQAIHLSEHDEQTGTWTVTFPKDRIDLLMYAFEQAALAGKQGDWKYINGVLGRLAQRGISSLGQAEDYDFDRDENKGAF